MKCIVVTSIFFIDTLIFSTNAMYCNYAYYVMFGNDHSAFLVLMNSHVTLLIRGMLYAE